MTSKLDHSEYSQPSDICLLLKRPGMAKTHNPLKMLEPIKVPATASDESAITVGASERTELGVLVPELGVLVQSGSVSPSICAPIV